MKKVLARKDNAPKIQIKNQNVQYKAQGGSGSKLRTSGDKQVKKFYYIGDILKAQN